jgi:hypothetical protein
MFYYGLEGRSLDGYFQIKEMTAPDTPPLNELRLYVKDKAGASALYLKDDAGSEREIAPAGVVTGAGIANRLAYWTGASTLAANAALVQNRLVTADVNGLPVSHTAVTATHVMFADSNGLPAGDSLFTWNNTDKYLVLPLKFGAAGAQFYTWSTRAGAFLTQQSQSSSTDHRFELYTKDGDGTDSMSLTLFAKGTPAALTNFEQLRLEYDSADTTFKLLTNAGGTGTIRPLRLFTGANTSQLILNIDGTISTAGAASLATGGGNLIIGGGATASRLRLLEASGSGTNYTEFVTQPQAGNITYTLPADDGDAGEQLQTDGSGNLSWEAAASLAIGNSVGSGTTNRILYEAAGPVLADSADLTYDGTDLALGSGKRFRMLSQNRIRYLNSTAAARSAADLTGRAVNTVNTITWDTDVFDTDTIHDTGANTSRLTAQITGKYLVSGGFQVANDTSLLTPTVVFALILVNGTTYRGVGIGAIASGGDGGANACSIISLAAGDYVELQDDVVATSGTYKIPANTRTQFSMAYIGE